jgi:hypothetical protein
MIRLGSLAGYPFEGPRVLAGWQPPAVAAVYAIFSKLDPESKPNEYSVIYIGHSTDLSKEGFPFNHPLANLWIAAGGTKFNLFSAYYEILGGLPTHREQIVQELLAIYEPRCNEEKYSKVWNDQWIGEYKSIGTEFLTTKRDPNETN